MNGYFQLDCKAEGTFLRIYNATDDGDPVKVTEVAEYLQKKGIPSEITELNRKILSIAENGVFRLDSVKRYPEREMMMVTIAADKMSAYVRFYPASVGGVELDKEGILSDLHAAGVFYGIDMNAIEAYLASREYCKDILIATGLPPRHGTDASIRYYFNTDLRVRPTLKEDGSVDFFNLNTMNHIKKGDLLARLTPEDPGENGCTVTNEYVKPRDVKRLIIKTGRNISMSEDKLEAYSEVDGHVSLTEDKIFVSDIYNVENVDNSTGNIYYDGSVHISGNVCTNFSVEAKGNVEIMGLVEGASIIADGDIVIARGVNGMGKGYLKAGGNIIVKFIENATAIAGGYVETEAILHSKVMAKTEVNVDGRKGMISGSTVSAANSISVKVLGSQMGADTVLELGIDPTMKLRHQQLLASIDNNKKRAKQIEPVLVSMKKKIAQGEKLPADKLKYIGETANTYRTLTEQMKADVKEFEEIENLMKSNHSSFVKVKDVAYAGTKISFSEVSTILKSDAKYCKFYREGADVKTTSL